MIFDLTLSSTNNLSKNHIVFGRCQSFLSFFKFLCRKKLFFFNLGNCIQISHSKILQWKKKRWKISAKNDSRLKIKEKEKKRSKFIVNVLQWPEQFMVKIAKSIQSCIVCIYYIKQLIYDLSKIIYNLIASHNLLIFMIVITPYTYYFFPFLIIVFQLLVVKYFRSSTNTLMATFVWLPMILIKSDAGFLILLLKYVIILWLLSFPIYR